MNLKIGNLKSKTSMVITFAFVEPVDIALKYWRFTLYSSLYSNNTDIQP